MTATINLSINNCIECPHCKVQRHWTEDSWERAYDYFCDLENDRSIATYIEWKHEIPLVPFWCPINED